MLLDSFGVVLVYFEYVFSRSFGLTKASGFFSFASALGEMYPGCKGSWPLTGDSQERKRENFEAFEGRTPQKTMFFC